MDNTASCDVLGHIESMDPSDICSLSGIQLFIKVSWDFKSRNEKKTLSVQLKECQASLHSDLTRAMGNLTLDAVPKKPVRAA